MFSFHLLAANASATARACIRPPTNVAGLDHMECMFAMRLGFPVTNPRRYRPNQLAIFARWEDEDSLERFLASQSFGKRLATGWHVRMHFYRRWGHVSEIGDLPEQTEERDPSLPVVAVTLARLKLTESLRFLHWGRPVERLVRDHPGQTLALAAMRPRNTLSTFSIWKSEAEMTNMVRGRSDVNEAKSHAQAMGERNRRDFHHEFTTLRFRPVTEHGRWGTRQNIIPGLPKGPSG